MLRRSGKREAGIRQRGALRNSFPSFFFLPFISAERIKKMVAAEAVPPVDVTTRGDGDVIVGYALTEKKCKSLFSPELIAHAR